MTQSSCPICKKPAEASTAPFCSARCQQIDLSRWLTGAYRVPTEDSASAESGDDDGALDNK